MFGKDADMLHAAPVVCARIGDADLVGGFHTAMLDICRRALAESPLLGYTHGPFDLEISEYGGLETAKRCLHSNELGAGFVALCRANRLDLTLEALIYENPRWHPLFTEEELATCAARLRQYGYQASQPIRKA